ncbi:MAG: hypothetical protein IJ887_06130 [Prevotella sp.]|nr:hypothetical protein [Prevotella sp.]
MDQSSKIDKLVELQKLLEAGVLTKEELEEQKKKILETKENEEPESPSIIDSEELAPETSFFQKYKIAIVGASAIIIVALLSFLFFQKGQSSQNISNDSEEEAQSIVAEAEQDSIYLVNSVTEELHYIFCFKIQGEAVSGYAKMAGNSSRASLEGTIDKDRWLIIRVTEDKETGRFEGKLDSDSFSGTLFPPNGKETTSWNAKRMTKEQVNELENKVNELLARMPVVNENQQESDNYSFTGVIQGGDKQYTFTMSLGIENDGNVTGYYYVTNGENKPVELSGQVEEWADNLQGNITLYEFDSATHKATGYYFQGFLSIEHSELGRFAGYSIEGYYKNSDKINWPFTAQTE